MDHGSSSHARPRHPARLWLPLAGGLIALAVLAAWLWRRGDSAADPLARLIDASPYRNVRPGVQYVGDESCIVCHGDIADSYRRHPMGRSLFPVADAAPRERYDAKPFRLGPLEYFVEKTAAGVKHHEVLRGPKGEELAHQVEDVAFTVGSGTHGRSYLIRRGPQLFQSPISWYIAPQQWDLSPGYHKNNLHFERPIVGACLYCHANQTEAVPGSLGAFTEPIFRGHAIGCERCHGPGELHVQRQQNGEPYPAGADDTIVNPRRLTPELRDDVCAQCHLQGEQRVVRRGRTLGDFRPGLPFPAFEVVFVRPPHLVDYQKAVGQFEQMSVSVCFQKSAGALGCISCHDPHLKPTPEDKAAFFRGRCQECHNAKRTDCTVAHAERVAENGDSCIACHMPPNDSSNIVHTSVTDHRIPRRSPLKPAPRREALPWEPPVIPFHQRRLEGDGDLERDFGIALVRMADSAGSAAPALQAQARLQKALERDPGDQEALESLGLGLFWQQDFAAAAEATRKLLTVAPRRESALVQAALCARLMKKIDEEAALLERLTDVNPNHAPHWSRLAEVRLGQQQWPAARAAALEALRLSAAKPEPRRVLIQALLRLGEVEQARRQLAVYEALAPDDLPAVRKLFTP